MELTPEEQELADKYNAAEEIVDDLDKQLYDLFMKNIQPLLDAGDYEAARAHMIPMPACVSRMYVADAIRVARGDYDK